MKIRKGDKVKVITGKDKGREGVVERAYNKMQKLVIPQINMFKKHIKKSEQMPQGGIVEVPRALDISKVMLICPKCGKASRVGYEVKNGKKTRICNKCKSAL